MIRRWSLWSLPRWWCPQPREWKILCPPRLWALTQHPTRMYLFLPFLTLHIVVLVLFSLVVALLLIWREGQKGFVWISSTKYFFVYLVLCLFLLCCLISEKGASATSVWDSSTVEELAQLDTALLEDLMIPADLANTTFPTITLGPEHKVRFLFSLRYFIHFHTPSFFSDYFDLFCLL